MNLSFERPVVRALALIGTLLVTWVNAVTAAPVPSVTLNVPSSPMVGEPFSFTVEFDNTSPTDVGYGPYVDVELPTIGADGAGPATDDGISFVSATFLGVPVTSTVLTCPVASHPYTGLPVSCTAGNQLVVLQLPFGSFTNTQPPATITVNVNLSNLADVGTPLTIRATPAFRYGADPLDNPGTDPPIFGSTQSASATPTLMRLAKSYNGPEDETATGPNFPRRYTITVDIANGQTITNLDVFDFLPNNLAYLSLVSSSPAGGVVVQSPPSGVASNAPNNVLQVRFPSVTGGTGSADASVTFEFFVPEFDANGARVLPANTGDDALSLDNARTEGDWTPIDPRDPSTHPVVDPAGPEHTLTDKAIAIQKSATIVTDVGPPGMSPGDVVEYTLSFQISDFFAFQNIRIQNDVLSDGQRFDTTFAPILSVTENGATSTGPFSLSNYSVTVDSPGTGTSTLFFDISSELVTRGFSGILLGGLVPDGPPTNDGPTTGFVRYRAYILDQYTDNYPSGDPSLNSGDSVSNSVNIVGDVLDNTTLTPTGFDENDGSGAGLTMPIGTLSKSLYARNGIVGPFTQVAPGDTITFRFQYTIPTGDVENLRFQDFLPLPVLHATELTTFLDTVSAIAPPAGSAQFGPADTFRSLSGIVPTISTDAVANMVQFTYGTFQNAANNPAVVDILFTVTVSADPFADGLFLTNQVRALEQNTVIEQSQSDAIVQFQLTEPVIRWSNIKGAVASSNPSAVFSPSPVGPVTFSAPGGGCPRFTSTIHSNGLATNPIRSDVSNVDAGDRVTFAIVVENRGTGLTGAFDVRLRDTMPAGFSIPSGGLNLCVTDGTGAPISYVNLGSGLFDPAGGIELVDPGPTSTPEGALDPYSPTSGRNIAIITYDLELDGPGDPSPVTPRQTLTNTATLLNYAGAEGGPNHVVTPPTDSATTTIASPTVAKVIQSIVPNGTGASSVTAGDIVTYAITVTLPEGTTPGLTLTDLLPTGFQYVAGSVTVVPGTFNGTVTTSPTVTTSGSPATGQTVNMSFGTVTVNDDNNATNNSFVVTLQAQVLNIAQNSGASSPQTKTNRVTLNFTGNPGSGITATVSTTFREPRLVLSKTMSPNTPDAGDLVTITLVVTNTGTSQAHDVVLTDTLPTDLFDTTPLISVNEGTTPSGFVYAYVPPTVTYSGGPIPAGASRTFTFTARVRADVVTGSSYVNPASVTGDSQSGVVPEQRTTTANASATASVPSTTANKVVAATSENSTDPGDANANTNPPVAIGEVITFRLSFSLPEGVTRNVTLADVLPSGLEHVPGTAFLVRNSTALAAANNPGNINAAAPGVPVPVTLSGTTGEVSLALGDVTNSDNNNSTTETYDLILGVVVQNVATNNAGTSLVDVGRIRYNNFNNVTQQVDTAPRTVHVAEPQLSVDKSVSPTTAAGGDTVTFTLVISNTASGANAASAFDWTITDTLPVQYLSPSVSSVNTGGTGAVVAAGFVGNTLNATIDQLDPGESITITYTATVDPGVSYAQVITNTANAVATSLPGPNGTGGVTPGAPGSSTGERTGSGGVNDLTAQDSAQVTVDAPSLTKVTVNPQSYTPVLGTATFRITAAAPVGTTNNLVFTDTLASGLEYVPGSLNVSLPPGATSSNSPLTDSNPAFFTQSGSTLTFNFGTVVVPTAGAIQITYDVRVRNILANQDGVILGNSALMQFSDPNTPGTITVGPVATPDPVRVGEPNLTLYKFAISGAVGSDAGDTVRWRVVLQNSGHTPAYRLNWQDVLPNGLYQISNIVVTPTGGNVYLNGTTTTVTSAHAVVSTTLNTNDTISLPLLELWPGAVLFVEFDSVVMNTVVPGQVLNNAIRANYTSLPTGGRDNSTNPGAVDDDNNADLNNYEESTSQAITVASSVAIDKSVLPSTYTIGETVAWRIRIDVIEGSIPSLIVTDVLPAGLTYVGHTITFGHMGMVATNPAYNTRLGAGQTVQFNFGDLVNPASGSLLDDFVIVEIRARVDNVASNQNNTVLRNGEQADGSTVSLQYGTGTPTVIFFDDDAGTPGLQGLPITIVEPELSVQKTVSPTQQSLGDEVTFTVTVQHLPTSTATAYDIVISDTLPAGLSYVVGSASLPAGDVTVSGQNLTFRIASLTVAAGARTFTYRARVEPSAVVGQPLTNNLTMVWASLPGATGAPTSGRTGSGGVNDYSAASQATVTPQSLAFIDAVKTVQDLNGGTVLPGDSLLYTVTLINGSTTVNNVVFTDVLPMYLTYTPGTLTTSAGSGSASGNTLTVTIPTLAPNQTVTITFEATVNAGTPQGALISNQGTVDSSQTSPEPTDWDGDDRNGDQPTDVVVDARYAGQLRATKSVALIADTVPPTGTINDGDTVQFTIVLQNTGSAPLTGVTFTDVVPLGPPGVLVTAVTTTQGTAPPPSNNVVISDIGTIAPGATVTVTITGTVNGAGVVCNQGIADSNETAPRSTDSNGDATDGSQSTCFTAEAAAAAGIPSLVIDKNYILLADTNGNGRINVGEIVRYTVAVTNRGSGNATNVLLDDPVPSGVSVIPGTVVPSQGAVVTEDPLLVNLGILAPGAVATVRYDAIVDTASPGSVITNTATARDAQGDNAAASESFSVQSSSIDVAISKSHTDAFTVGQTASYVLTVRNSGSLGTTGPITVTDTLPNGLSYVSASGPGWSCGASGQTVTCTYSASLPSSATASFTLTVLVGSAAYPTVTNTAVVSTIGDSVASNNTASDPTTIRMSGAATNTPTRTATRTPTPTGVSGTPTGAAGTPTRTLTPTRTPTVVAGTPTRTFSPTRTPTVTRTQTSVPTPTPTRTGTSTRTPTRTPTPVLTPTPAPSRVPTTAIECSGNKRLRIRWSPRQPGEATVWVSASRCSPPPRCFTAPEGSSVLVPPVVMSVSDPGARSIESVMESVPTSQGRCPGGVDSFCHSSDVEFHIDRIHFSYGRDGVTNIRGKLHFRIDPPVLPSFETPITVRISDQGGYEVELTFYNCGWRNTTLSTLLTCY